jgi:hypothetical protein
MLKSKPPFIVFCASLIPGAGHVLLGQPQRGLMFIFFMTILGWISLKLMPENASFVGRHIGGVFIWGMSVIDAYRINQKNSSQ